MVLCPLSLVEPLTQVEDFPTCLARRVSPFPHISPKLPPKYGPTLLHPHIRVCTLYRKYAHIRWCNYDIWPGGVDLEDLQGPCLLTTFLHESCEQIADSALRVYSVSKRWFGRNVRLYVFIAKPASALASWSSSGSKPLRARSVLRIGCATPAFVQAECDRTNITQSRSPRHRDILLMRTCTRP